MALSLVAPLAFLMGMPFPTGCAGHRGPNSILSVVSSMATMVTTVTFGFTWAILGGAAFYLIAALVSRPLSRSS